MSTIFTDEPDTNQQDRRITYGWHVGDRQQKGYLGSQEPWKQVWAQLVVSHDKDHKRFEARLSNVDKEFHEGYTTTGFHIGGPYYVPAVYVLVRPVARYSEKAFYDFADEALALLREVAATEASEAVAQFETTLAAQVEREVV